MDVILALGAELRKMFAGDLLLSAGALAGVILVGILARADLVPPSWIPIVLALVIVVVLAVAVGLSASKEFRKRSI
ncbi:MAG: hypothetical protein ACREEB_13430 [Caulobacteraceae bacterium]